MFAWFCTAIAVEYKQRMSKPAAVITVALYAISTLVSYALYLIFGLVNILVLASYDEWKGKLLESAERRSSQSCEDKQSSEDELLKDLITRVGMSSSLTMKMRWLLLPTFFYLLAFVFALHDAYVDAPPGKILFLITERFFTLLMKMPSIWMVLAVSQKSGDLQYAALRSGFKTIAEYFRHAPARWMITPDMSFDFGLASGLGFLLTLGGLSRLFVDIGREALTQPWKVTYERFGTCSDGVRSGLEQHIDCGGPESGCPQTCRQKYGEYILIPGNRKCTQVDGYEYITTQRACALAYKSWSHLNEKKSWSDLNDMNAGPRTRVYMDASHSKEQVGIWNETFSCGAFSMPLETALITGRAAKSLPLSMANDQRVAFPAMFSTGHEPAIRYGLVSEEPIAHLCYAGTGCQGKSGGVNRTRFREQMSCPESCSSCNHDSASAWRAISAPIHVLKDSGFTDIWTSTLSEKLIEVVEFRAHRDRDKDCVEIKVDNSVGMGAQAVFTLACDVFRGGDHGNHSAGAGVRPSCPKGDRGSISLTPGQDTRSALLVFPASNMKHGRRYTLGPELSFVDVHPDSTLVLVVDHKSNLNSVKLCFDLA